MPENQGADRPHDGADTERRHRKEQRSGSLSVGKNSFAMVPAQKSV